jgi:hydrogenase nickel incorporation protein HypA/HybF
MHELPVIKRILDVCLGHAAKNNVTKIVSIELKVGEMSDLEPEWMQRYFDHVSKDTIAEGAKLVIEKVPVVLRCDSCSHEFEVNIKEKQEPVCTQCGGKKCVFVSGKEYFISNMAVV